MRDMSTLFAEEVNKTEQSRIFHLFSIELLAGSTTGSTGADRSVLTVVNPGDMFVGMNITISNQTGFKVTVKITAINGTAVTINSSALNTNATYTVDYIAELHLVDSNYDVMFNGVKYLAFPIKFGEMTVSSDATIDKANLSVANVSREITYYVETYDGLKNRKVTVKTVYERFLDQKYFLKREAGSYNPREYYAPGDTVTYSGGNLIFDPSTLDSHRIYISGTNAEITDLGSSISNGVAHVAYSRTGTTGADYRVRTSAGAYNINIDKTKAAVYTVELKPVKGSLDLYATGPALNNQASSQARFGNLSQSGSMTMYGGCSLISATKVTDGFWRISIQVPASFWTGTGDSCFLFIGTGWNAIETREYYYRNPSFVQEELTTNIVADTTTLANHELVTYGTQITDTGSTLAGGVAHLVFTRTGTAGSDRRVRSSTGGFYPVDTDKDSTFMVDIKPVQAASPLELYMSGPAVDDQPNSQRAIANVSLAGVISEKSGCSAISSVLLSDGYYRLTIKIPSAFWTGSGSTYYLFVGTGWNVVGSYEYYYRLPTLRQATTEVYTCVSSGLLPLKVDGAVNASAFVLASPEEEIVSYTANPEKDVTAALEDAFLIDSYTYDENVCTFSLDPAVSLDVKLPRRKFFPNSCQWKYRDAHTCKYTGADPVGQNGCPKTLAACKQRGNQARYGGFPGISGNRRVWF